MDGEVLTERLRCRAPRDDEHDRSRYEELLLSPEIQRWLQPSPLEPLTAADVAALLSSDVAHWPTYGFGPWVLELREDGRFAGRGGLKTTTVRGEPAVELPWSVVPALQGRGLATEAGAAALQAARALGLPEVVSYTLTTNLASQRVMERIGLRRDGELEHAGLPHVLYRLALD